MNHEKYEICTRCHKRFPKHKLKKVGVSFGCKSCMKECKTYRNYTSDLEDIKIFVWKAFGSLFNQEEILEILFHPENRLIREERINEFISSLSNDIVKSEVRTIFTNILTLDICTKIILYLGVFHMRKGINYDEFDEKKLRIFGEEVQNISLVDDCFIGIVERSL
jgi:hypothetical protein